MDRGPAPPGTGGGGAGRSRHGRVRWALILLLIPFVALLYPPFYSARTPQLAGIPFFIWYQFLWVILGVLITGIVYLFDRPDGAGK